MTRTPEAARQRWVILAVIVLAQTVANVGPLGIPAIASLIRDDLGLTLTQAGSFLSVYYLGPVTMSFFAGMLADRWGTAKTLVLGQALIAGGLLAASTAGSYGVLLALLGIAGVGYGTLNPASTTAAMSWFPPRQRATVVGLKQVGLPFGGMLGAALMPALALRLGWRWAIAAGALAIVACAALCATVYRDPTGEAPLRRAAGQRGTVAEVLRSRDLWLVASATLVFAAMQTVWMAFLALYLQEFVGLALLAASRYLALAQAGGVLGRVAFGVLSDRTFGGRRRTPLVIAGCGSALCSLAIAFTGPGAGPWLRAAHPHGRARRAALGRHRGRARARHLLARRDARPARLRLVRDGGGRLSRPVDRPLARDAGGARSPRARPRARAVLGACRNRGAPRLRRGATSGWGGWGAISGPPIY